MDKENPSLNDFLPSVDEGYVAKAGLKLKNIRQEDIVSRADIMNVISKIYDPEIPVNIYELGLIYNIHKHDNGDVDIEMSLTAPSCPVAGELPKEVANKVSELKNVGLVSVHLIWQPAWTPERMSEDAKMALGYSSTRTRTTITSTIATDASTGVITLSLTATETTALEAPARYVYDVEITQTSTGQVTRVIEGIITIRPNVTT